MELRFGTLRCLKLTMISERAFSRLDIGLGHFSPHFESPTHYELLCHLLHLSPRNLRGIFDSEPPKPKLAPKGPILRERERHTQY